MPHANSTTSSPRATSPSASLGTLPCSAVMIAASSSVRAASSSRNRNSIVVRSASDVARHAGERRLRRRDGGVDVGRRRERDLLRDLAGRGVEDVAGACDLAGRGKAADPVRNQRHGRVGHEVEDNGAVSGSFTLAASASVVGTVQVGEGALLAQGAVVRSVDGAVAIGTGSAVLELCVVVGTPTMPTTIGRRTVFGHRCLVVGAELGDLCEIGNASILMPGARLGNRVFLGEGTLVPSGMTLPDDAVALGRPARVDPPRVRRRPRAPHRTPRRQTSSSRRRRRSPSPTRRSLPMGQLYAYRDIRPTVAASAVLFPSAELTGDVVIGERTIIGAGVKIIGDSHGPVRIGNDVQILENTVLHLLPDNDLILGDGVIIGPGAMIHGCRIGAGSVVEPGAIVCDHSVLGEGCIVRAGAVVKQRAAFAAGVEVDGFPAKAVGRIDGRPTVPPWAFALDDAAGDARTQLNCATGPTRRAWSRSWRRRRRQQPTMTPQVGD